MANRQGDTNTPAQQSGSAGGRNDRTRNQDDESVVGRGDEDVSGASEDDEEFEDTEDLDEEEEEGEGSF